MLLRIVILLSLGIGTAAFSVGYSRYAVSNENLLQNPRFENDLLNWERQSTGSIRIADGILSLANVARKDNASVTVAQKVRVPFGQRLLFLSCEARALNVVPGGKPWQAARVLIFPLTTEGKARYDVPHTLTLLDGTRPWTTFERTFRIPEETATVSVVVQLLNASGAFEVRAITLNLVAENPSYFKWRNTLILMWFILGLWVVWPLIVSAPAAAGRIAVLITGAIILTGILVPAHLKYAMTPSWMLPEREVPGPFRADLLEGTYPFHFALFPIDLNVYKLAHLLLFALIGYLLIARRPYTIPITAQIGIIGMFALATESMQVLASGRGGSLSDVLIDLCGVFCGMLVAVATRHYFGQRLNFPAKGI